MARDELEQSAIETPFDNSTNGFISENTQAAIEEVQETAEVLATPGFSFGRGGNASSNTWLINAEVPSNIVGIPIGIDNPIITEIWAGSQNIDTYDIEIYEHDGNEINLTLVTTVSIVSQRTETFTGLSIPLTSGKQLAARIANGSAKNPKCFVLVKGTT